MKIIKPRIIIPSKATMYKLNNPDEVIEFLADSARISYQSFDKKNGIETEKRLLSNCIKNGHTSVLEHDILTFDFITDRSISHELIRHRIASYIQESTRYVKYDGDMEFIRPIFRENGMYTLWEAACKSSEQWYISMIKAGAQPQEARSVLNNSLKTHIRITRNFRAMREFLTLRCAKNAHPEIKELCIPLLLLLKDKFDIIFNDIEYDEEFMKQYMDDWHTYIDQNVVKENVTEIRRIELVEES